MICKPCRKAGELNKLLDGRTGHKHIEKMAHGMHNDCPGGNWCDCQHAIGQVLNAERIEGKNAVTE